MLLDAMRGYHNTIKSLLETALVSSDLESHCCPPNQKGKPTPNGFATSKFLRTLTPKGWNLAPLRDYLIEDASAALMSYLAKNHKGKNLANPPTLPHLHPISDEQFREAYNQLTLSLDFQPKKEHQEIIAQEAALGHTRVAHRLQRIFTARAQTKAASQILRELDGPTPRPIEFTHCEFGRGFLLAKRGNRLYCLLKLFSPGHRRYEKKVLDTDFVDIKSGLPIGGKAYPGVILPLEFGRKYHEEEYLRFASPHSAKLIAKPQPDGSMSFFVHVAFEFHPHQIKADSVLGIDRGAAMIGAASLLNSQGEILQSGMNLSGATFAAEMAAFQRKIADLQRRGKRHSRIFRLRGARADAVLGEYANQVIALAVQHRSQIVLEKLDGVAFGRFLKQSQFAKLLAMLNYKALRQGLPAPIEVPAAGTSQTCAVCGYRDKLNRPKLDAAGKPLQDRFLCLKCGHHANADENASILIALRGIHQLEQGDKLQKWDAFAKWLQASKGRDNPATSSLAT